jgi:hypothetical protein
MDFITIRNTDPVNFIVLSDFISAHDVHWVGNRTQPCRAPKAKCEWCEAQKPIRWKGYLHCLAYPETGKSIFLCLTPAVGWELMQSDPPPTILRGRMLVVWRANKAATSKMLWRWKSEHQTGAMSLPPALDPGEFLETVFRLRKPLAD